MPIPSGYTPGAGDVPTYQAPSPYKAPSPYQNPSVQNLSGRTYNTGIPGFENLSQSASGNVGNLLNGTESPDITRNIAAQWGAGSGQGSGSDFVRNRSADLYGQRSEARKSQGLQGLLAMLQGYSGTVTARPGDILGAETSRYGTDVGSAISRYGTDVGSATSRYGTDVGARTATHGIDVAAGTAAARLGQEANQFGFTFPEQQRQYDISSRNQNNQFNANLGLNYLNSYMNFLH